MHQLTDEQYAEVEKALKENIELRKEAIQYRKDLADLKDLIMKFLAIIGFSDGKRMHPGVFLPEDHPQHKSPMRIMISAIGDLGQMALGAKFSKQAESKLKEKFAFITQYAPLIEKYGRE